MKFKNWWESFFNKVRLFIKDIDLPIRNFLKNDKEIWDYEEVREFVKESSKFFTIVICLVVVFFMVLNFNAFQPFSAGFDIKENIAIVGAIIAGSFTMLSSIGNTENSIRSLRSKWLDDSRESLSKYISRCRWYLSLCSQLKNKRNSMKRREYSLNEFEGVDDEYVKIIRKDIDKIKGEVSIFEERVYEARMSFFDSYAEMNVRFRSIKKGEERLIFNVVRKHYQSYRKLCESLVLNKEKVSDFHFRECYKLDTELADKLGEYFLNEWSRAKRGDENLVAKKRVIFIVLSSIIIYYLIGLIAG